MQSILVIAEEKEAFHAISLSLQGHYKVLKVPDRNSAFEIIAKTHPKFIFVDIEILRDLDSGLKHVWILNKIWSISPSSDVIVLTQKEKIRDAVKAIKAGANEYLTYPIREDEVWGVIKSINEYADMHPCLDHVGIHVWNPDSSEKIQTNCTTMKTVFERIRLVAPTRATVLLTGETGTGKGVMARLIHHNSNRKTNHFVSVHCGAIPDTLIESELFGHEKGAFTGADHRKQGKFEIAGGGTIFLDEVGTLTPSAQIKLLQVLQEGILQRVGGEETFEVDVRIIAATNLNLKTACNQGKFRKDLYYRLNVFSIEIPPLRERIDDLPYFIDLFLERFEKTGQKNIRGVHPKVMESFRRHSWPGNIRELQNVLEQAYILGHSPLLTIENFPREISMFESDVKKAALDASLGDMRRQAVSTAERSYLLELLARNHGKVQNSAVAAGITTRQLNKLMTKHHIKKVDFKF